MYRTCSSFSPKLRVQYSTEQMSSTSCHRDQEIKNQTATQEDRKGIGEQEQVVRHKMTPTLIKRNLPGISVFQSEQLQVFLNHLSLERLCLFREEEVGVQRVVLLQRVRGPADLLRPCAFLTCWKRYGHP